jgi:hypothetical protein
MNSYKISKFRDGNLIRSFTTDELFDCHSFVYASGKEISKPGIFELEEDPSFSVYADVGDLYDDVVSRIKEMVVKYERIKKLEAL